MHSVTLAPLSADVAVDLCLNSLASIKKNKIGSFIEMWTNLESVIQSEVSQKDRDVFLTDRSPRI